MQRDISIIAEKIDETALQAGRKSSAQMGAVIYFLGVVRDTEGPDQIAALEYEAFEKMARHQFDLILDQVEKRWPIGSVRLVHRVGRVGAGEPSLWVEVTAPHRAEAFAACQFLIDEMKKVVPIWKKAVF